MLHEVLKMEERTDNQGGKYTAIDLHQHHQSSTKGVAICGYVEIRHPDLTYPGGDADRKSYPTSNLPVRASRCITYCSPCDHIYRGVETNGGYILELGGRQTRSDGVVLSDWIVHERVFAFNSWTHDVDPLRDQDKAFCGYSAHGIQIPRNLSSVVSERDEGMASMQIDCSDCAEVKESRRREALLDDPEWVEKKMSELRDMQNRHRRNGGELDTRTVGDLIDALSEFDRELPIVLGSDYLVDCCEMDTEYSSAFSLSQQDGWTELPDTGGRFILDVHPGGVERAVVRLR